MQIKPRLDKTRQVVWPKPPWNVAVVVGRLGTLEGRSGIVMADEMMAYAVASGFSKSDMVKSSTVVDSTEPISSKHDVVFMMHRLPHSDAWQSIGSRPAWLWIHNANAANDLSILCDAAEQYQGVWHAGMKTAARLGLSLWPHGVEDPDVFKPYEKKNRIVYVGNAVMHTNAAILIGKFSAEFKEKFCLYGSSWERFGIANNGKISMYGAGKVIGESSVALDTVSEHHVAEGMCSTRIHQALACESAVVTVQPRENIPEWAWPYITFASDDGDALRKAARLLGDPMERARKTNGCRAATLKHSIQSVAHKKWIEIESILNSSTRRTS